MSAVRILPELLTEDFPSFLNFLRQIVGYRLEITLDNFLARTLQFVNPVILTVDITQPMKLGEFSLRKSATSECGWRIRP
jgi:hypothetical protein